MDTNEIFEIKANAFRQMTGHMAPGKDAPSVSYPSPFDERFEAWEKWQKDNAKCINAMINAFNSIMDLDT